MLTTRLCEILGIRVPIIQAPMAGGVTTPELVAAVAEAGALGSFGFAYTQPERMQLESERVRELTRASFNINLFAARDLPPLPEAEQRSALDAVKPYFEELGLAPPQAVRPPFAPDFNAQLDAVRAIRPAVFTAHLGDIDTRRIAALREQGTRIGGSATCVAEAKHLEALGVDFIIAQGAEAGGHRGTYLKDPNEAMTGTLALVRLIVSAVKVPVVAAGGIMDGAGIAAVLALGAEAAQLGTAFVPCIESGASRVHKDAILASDDDDTLITDKFSGKPARGIVNRYMREMSDAPTLPFPAQNMLTGPLRAAASKAGNADFPSLWSGQAAALSRELPAAALVASLHEETREALERLSGLRG